MMKHTIDQRNAAPSLSPDEFTKYTQRVGHLSKDRWKWMLRLVNRYRIDRGESWLHSEWDIVCGELAAFTLGETSAPGWGVIALTGGVFTEKPPHKEAKAALDRCLEMIDGAVDHKPYLSPTVRVESRRDWDEKTSRYHRSIAYDDRTTWLVRICHPLDQMVYEDGQRLRRCPAQQPRGPNPCANLFLKAKRGKYCSPACASREMARAKRQRDQAHNRPARKRGRPRKYPDQQFTQGKKGAKHGTKKRTR